MEIPIGHRLVDVVLPNASASVPLEELSDAEFAVLQQWLELASRRVDNLRRAAHHERARRVKAERDAALAGRRGGRS